MAARILDVSIDDYHADKIGCERPSLSASIASTLVARSSLHAWQQHPRLGGSGKTATKAMDAGTVVHKLILGAGRDLCAIDAPDYRTKAAQTARDEARARGDVPILADDLEEARRAADAIRARFADRGILFDGAAEVAIAWTEAGPDGPVECRCMVDHLREPQGVIYDLKTTRNASPDVFERSMVEHGYDIQYTAYCRALAALRPDLCGRIDMLFLCAELEPPYAVMIGRPSGDLEALGAKRWERAVRTWGRCLTEGRWPGYEGISPLHAPMWAIQREEYAEL